jgi:hypothetical protein
MVSLVKMGGLCPPKYDARGVVMDWLDSINEQEIYDSLIPSARLAGLIEMGKGILWTLGGAVLSWGTYQSASVYGGTYAIFWGAMLYGALRILRGVLWVIFPRVLVNRVLRD